MTPFGLYFLIKFILLNSLMELMANFITLTASNTQFFPKDSTAWPVHFIWKIRPCFSRTATRSLLRKADTDTTGSRPKELNTQSKVQCNFLLFLYLKKLVANECSM